MAVMAEGSADSCGESVFMDYTVPRRPLRPQARLPTASRPGERPPPAHGSQRGLAAPAVDLQQEPVFGNRPEPEDRQSWEITRVHGDPGLGSEWIRRRIGEAIPQPPLVPVCPEGCRTEQDSLAAITNRAPLRQ